MVKLRIYLTLGLGIFALLFFLLGIYATEIKSAILFNALRGKNISELSTGDKIIMFKEYIDRKDIPNALKVASKLEGHTDELSKDERIYLAHHLGNFLRATDGLVQEMGLYDDLFKKDFPVYYHFFRASAFEFRKDIGNLKQELALAKDYAEQTDDTNMKITIEKILRNYSVA